MALYMLKAFCEKEFRHPLLIWLMILCWYAFLGQNLLDSPGREVDDFVAAQSFWLFNEPPKEADAVTIVAIDQTSRKRLGVKWPWERHLTATLIQNIAAFSPKTIGLDIIFSGTSEKAQDDALISALQAHPSTVLGYILQDTSRGRPDQPLQHLSAGCRLSVNDYAKVSP